jgi:ketosteroid isomerase-like protein
MIRLVTSFRSVVMLGLLAGTALAAPLRAEDAVTQELHRLEDAWGKAEMAKDGDALGRLLAEDFVAIGPDGATASKAEYVASIKANKETYVSGEDTDRKVRVYGNAAVDTGLWTETLKEGNDVVSSRYRWTSVWIKQADGRWLCVTMQTLRVPEGH